MKVNSNLKDKAEAINRELAKAYPDAKCALNYKNPFELLAATILSAQCTDERVNMVTPALFKRCPNAKALASIPQEELEELIRTTGFFRNKAKSLIGMAAAVAGTHKGKVPAHMDELRKLPGVGRKTANVVLGNCFDTPGITVDTHMSRLSQRMGLTRNSDPEKIEQDLIKLIPEKEWTLFSHRIITHGRQVCQARRPLCERCPVTNHCDYFQRLQRMAAKESKVTRVKKQPKKQPL
jgi:endonuclease III